MDKKWDLIIAGGGLAGASAAIASARSGCKVLIIEKNGFLGGCATASLVTPMMKNSDSDGNPLNKGLYLEILNRLAETKDSATHPDRNPGWFNPEQMKFVLDELCGQAGVDLLFESYIVGAENINQEILSVSCINKGGYQKYNADYFIDATGDADLAVLCGVETEHDKHQSLSLRFIMENVNLFKFGEWIRDIEPEMVLSSVEYIDFETILLTTAHTNEDIGWKLRPFIQLGIKEGVIMPEDAEYVQLFSIPGQRNALAFNCPRVYSVEPLNPLDPWDRSYAYIQGRKQIKRIAKFFKSYITGFEESYVSQVAPELGVRVSRRIKGKYQLKEQDIIDRKKFDNTAAKSNYPFDIHGEEKDETLTAKLKAGGYYEIPIASMIPTNVLNLLVAGKPLSSTFNAQSSARIMPNCIAMGESAGIYAAARLKLKESL